jgi:hypothetical protein
LYQNHKRSRLEQFLEVAMSATIQIGMDWIQRANARPIGQIEFRQVRMEIGNNNGGRILEIRTLREIRGDVAQSLFCVMKPRPLSNINYTVREQRGQIEPFDIQLYLPFVLGTLRNLPSDRRREGHLGSDFSYDDLRVWLYEEGHQYEIIEVDSSRVRVRGSCIFNDPLVRHGAAPFEILLDSVDAFIRCIDYLAPNGFELVRQYRADDITTVDNVTVAGRMTMHDRKNNHTTVITLERAWYDREIEAEVFEPSFRKHTFDYLAAL